MFSDLFGKKPAPSGSWTVPIDGGPLPVDRVRLDETIANTVTKPVHKGMFGIKGDFRDILGVISDGLLATGGKPGVYSAQRQREKYQDAMSGFGENPLAAIQQAYGIDPNQASKDWDNYQDTELAKQKAIAEDKRYKTKEAREEAEHRGKMYDRAGRLMNPKVVNKKNWGATKDLYLKVLSRNGLTPPIDLPDEFDPVIAERLFSGAIEADDQARIEGQRENIELAERRVREAEQTGAVNRRNNERRTDAYVDSTRASAEYTRERTTNPEKFRTPTKSSGGRAVPNIGSKPPRPPAKKGETAISRNGDVWISRNGKTWVKQ